MLSLNLKELTFSHVFFVCLTFDVQVDRSVPLLKMNFEALHIPSILLLFFACNKTHN